MTRAAFIAAIAAVAILWPKIGCAQAQDEKPIIEVLQAAVDAQFAADFNRLVSLIHPQTQHLFRDELSAKFDQLLRLYALEEIAAVSGLPAHPKDLSLSDSEFFVFACNGERARHPEFVGDPRCLPLTICGSVFDSDQLARIVLTVSGSIHTERTDFNYLQPFTVSFRREGSQWFVWTDLLAERISDNWCRDLVKSRLAEHHVR